VNFGRSESFNPYLRDPSGFDQDADILIVTVATEFDDVNAGIKCQRSAVETGSRRCARPRMDARAAGEPGREILHPASSRSSPVGMALP
jgi:hypothetical protein